MWERRERPCYEMERVETLVAEGPCRFRYASVDKEIDPASGEVTVTERQGCWEVDAEGWLLPLRKERLVLGDGTFTLEGRPLTDAERGAMWATGDGFGEWK